MADAHRVGGEIFEGERAVAHPLEVEDEVDVHLARVITRRLLLPPARCCCCCCWHGSIGSARACPNLSATVSPARTSRRTSASTASRYRVTDSRRCSPIAEHAAYEHASSEWARDSTARQMPTCESPNSTTRPLPPASLGIKCDGLTEAAASLACSREPAGSACFEAKGRLESQVLGASDTRPARAALPSALANFCRCVRCTTPCDFRS